MAPICCCNACSSSSMARCMALAALSHLFAIGLLRGRPVSSASQQLDQTRGLDDSRGALDFVGNVAQCLQILCAATSANSSCTVQAVAVEQFAEQSLVQRRIAPGQAVSIPARLNAGVAWTAVWMPVNPLAQGAEAQGFEQAVVHAGLFAALHFFRLRVGGETENGARRLVRRCSCWRIAGPVHNRS